MLHEVLRHFGAQIQPRNPSRLRFDRHKEPNTEASSTAAAIFINSSCYHRREYYRQTCTNQYDKSIQMISGGDGKCVAEFKVAEEHLNRAGGLHGGYTATLVDVVTTYALMTKDNCLPGVSVDIHVTYLKAAKEGDDVIIDANTIRAGKNLAFLECELRHKKDNSIIARGQHTKYIGTGGGKTKE
ncbi:acyl-coenzyme A thioesterase 13-like isoform X1 [Topomyia yanbarensis]|uniref:acyl-coenzyme A thioesterase 13-like isoform X1 n=1 Tax=Topomyia yanbarensis TaxID=2498891 RepID=UPI00273ACEBB|nr:acyl-coenzyme A thioesterase 13-like isoform X1 [Topomyia yanbarensis]